MCLVVVKIYQLTLLGLLLVNNFKGECMPVGESAAIVALSTKAGVGMGLFATAIIFTDPAYKWMAIVGAIVGIGSAFHTLFESKDLSFTKRQVSAVMVKAFTLGIVAMPMTFLGITEGLLKKMIGVELGEVSISLSIVSAFAMSWYFTPILDSVVNKFREKR